MDAYKPECIVTGCSLQDEDEGVVSHGDLFIMGDVYVFNATAAEAEVRHLREGEKALVMGGETPYFERRGVYVIGKQAYGVRLNFAAASYVLAGSVRMAAALEAFDTE